jgi:hypothetical protein
MGTFETKFTIPDLNSANPARELGDRQQPEGAMSAAVGAAERTQS